MRGREWKIGGKNDCYRDDLISSVWTLTRHPPHVTFPIEPAFPTCVVHPLTWLRRPLLLMNPILGPCFVGESSVLRAAPSAPCQWTYY